MVKMRLFRSGKTFFALFIAALIRSESSQQIPLGQKRVAS